MRFTSENRALEVIPGNPLAARGNPDKSQPRLAVIQGRVLAEKRKPEERPIVISQPWYSRSWTWLRTNAPAMMVLLAAATIVWNLSGTYSRLGRLEEAINGQNGLVGKVSGMTDRLTKMEGRFEGFLNRAKALEVGLKDPQILPVAVSPTAPRQRVTSGPEASVPYSLEFGIYEITQDTITFSVGGKVGGTILKDNVVKVPFQIGVPIELTKAIGVAGGPHIFLVVLDLPTKNQAVVAVGPKTQTT
jgi:hypothetical protein